MAKDGRRVSMSLSDQFQGIRPVSASLHPVTFLDLAALMDEADATKN